MLMQGTRGMRMRGVCAAAALVAAAACGQIESVPTAPTDVPARSAPVASGTQRGPSAAPAPAPAPTPAPKPVTPSCAGTALHPRHPQARYWQSGSSISRTPCRSAATITTSPAAPAGQYWFYIRWFAKSGVRVTMYGTGDMFDGAVTARTNRRCGLLRTSRRRCARVVQFGRDGASAQSNSAARCERPAWSVTDSRPAVGALASQPRGHDSFLKKVVLVVTSWFEAERYV